MVQQHLGAVGETKLSWCLYSGTSRSLGCGNTHYQSNVTVERTAFPDTNPLAQSVPFNSPAQHGLKAPHEDIWL